MKNLLKKVMFAGAFVLVGTAVAGAGENAANLANVTVNNSGLCDLIIQMQNVFKILRTLAFVGAAFLVAQWAWSYIKAGDVKMDDLKDKGTGLLVGFILLFAIGAVLSFVLSSTGMEAIGCKEQLLGGWNNL